MISQAIVARAAIFVDGKLLIARRFEDGHADHGYWELPGGQVEPGEDPEAALIREVEEELGLRVKPLKVIKVSSIVYPKAKPTKQVFLIDYLVTADTGISDSISLSPEHSEWKLVAQEELSKLAPLRDSMREPLIAAFKAQ